MRKVFHRLLGFLLCALAILAPAKDARADTLPPIHVSGYLEAEDGRPMQGAFGWEIRLYADASTATQIGDTIVGLTSGSQETTATQGTTLTEGVIVEEGVFSIPLVLPDEAAFLAGFWFSLAIDTDRNGLDENDLFEDRFQVGAVPFALSGQATPFFTINAGSPLFNTSGIGDVRYLEVAPFCTPAGGVAFNRMAVYFEYREHPDDEPGTPLASFGIYDASGKAVALSGPLRLTDGFKGIVEAPVSARLKPSALYYAAWGASKRWIVIRPGLFQSAPGLGCIPSIVSNGTIPHQFDPSKIGQNAFGSPVPISITLRKVPEGKPGQ